MTRQHGVNGGAAVLRVQRQSDPVSHGGVTDLLGLVRQPALSLGLELRLFRGDQIAVSVLENDTPGRQTGKGVFGESRLLPIGPAVFLDQLAGVPSFCGPRSVRPKSV